MYSFQAYYQDYILLEVINLNIEDKDIVETEEENARICNVERLYVYDLKLKNWTIYYDRYLVKKDRRKKQIFRLRDGKEIFLLEVPLGYLR